MEFYCSSVFGVILSIVSFNSQRDGILLGYTLILIGNERVSIPNGMEFYPIFLTLTAPSHCFNSQRDGILRFPYTPAEIEAFCFNSQRDGILPRPVT